MQVDTDLETLLTALPLIAILRLAANESGDFVRLDAAAAAAATIVPPRPGCLCSRCGGETNETDDCEACVPEAREEEEREWRDADLSERRGVARRGYSIDCP